MPTYPLTGTDAATLEAKLANFRLGQSRLGYMNPVLRLTIAGTERSSSVVKSSVRIQMSAESPSLASFTIVDVAPVEGQTVAIAVGGVSNVLFGGVITKVSVTLPKGNAMGSIRYNVQCQDYTWLLNRVLVARQYGSDNVESILSNLFSTFSTGFTLTHVNSGLGFLTGPTPFTMENLEACIRRLAKEVNAYPRIDPSKDLHLFAAGQDRAPQPHDLTTAYTDFENVRYTVDLSQVKTRVYGEGIGTKLATTYTAASVVQVVDTSIFPTFASGTIYDLRIGNYLPVNGRRFRVFTIDSSVLQLAFPDNLNDDIIAAGPFVVGTDVNLWHIEEDTAAQTALAALEGGDGKHDYYLQDRRKGYSALASACLAELTRRKNPVETIAYRTHDPNTRPGAIVNVNVPLNLPTPTTITGSFTIQQVTITDIETATNRHPWYEVVATSNLRTLWDFLNSPTFAQVNPVR